MILFLDDEVRCPYTCIRDNNNNNNNNKDNKYPYAYTSFQCVLNICK